MNDSNSHDVLADIIVGVGGSDRSFAALQYALDLGRVSSRAVRAVVVDTIRMSLSMALSHGSTFQRMLGEAEQLADLHSDRIEERARRVAAEKKANLTFQRDEGPVVDCLLDASEQASLLVVGKRGHRDDHGGFLGTNTELLARRVKIPILLTPGQYRPIREVVVAYAAKEPGARNLAMALYLQQKLGVDLRIVTIAKDRKQGELVADQAKKALAERNASAICKVLVGRVADELCMTTRRDSLLIIGATGHSRAYRLILGDVTVEVMRGAQGPVLLSARGTYAT
ncbi:MAG: universal stress protein [Planctomycetota bacterium]